MAQLNYQADANDLQKGFEAFPAGEYKVMIINSDFVPTKKGDGMMVKLEMEVVGGDYKGRKLFENLVIQHPNHTTETIARQKLNTIAVCCGILNIRDTAQLHGKVMDVIVGYKNTPDYGEQNFVKTYKVPDAAGSIPAHIAADAAAPKNGGKKPSFVK